LFYGVLFGCVLLAIWTPQRLQLLKSILVSIRQRLRSLRLLVILIVILAPVVFLLYTVPGSLFTGTYLRLQIGFPVCFLLAIFLTRSNVDLVKAGDAVFAVLLYGSIFILVTHLTYVRNYPFSLTWSEGNRLYDYSVILGSQRYQYAGKLTLPYDTPGRYLLWGILFALPNTPIWLHRLWDAALSTVLYVLLGYLVARWTRLGSLGKISLALWIFLFLYQGPIYAPLLICAMIVVLTVSEKRIWLSLIGVTVASFYASISRWTWFPVPAIWAALIMLSKLDFSPGENWKSIVRSLVPAGLVALVGLAAGYLPNFDLFTPQQVSSGLVADQPLLWYRLLPNATYPRGILLGVLVATGALMALLAWAIIANKRRVHWIQGLAYCLASIITLAVGLVISVKIGGGSNLHNLDMFLVTLVVITGILLRDLNEIPWKVMPIPVQALLILVILIPAWSAFSEGEPLLLPTEDQVTKGIETIRREVTAASSTGEVLFMDQRQLLTFGIVPKVPLVPGYEKKYVMDMAMGNSQEYFSGFYSDLARKRFSLIVSEPLKEVEQGQINSFGEENDAWVRWVSNPILCYYEPIKTWKSIKVELLIPRPDPKDCPK
jgi:hypothetical protein